MKEALLSAHVPEKVAAYLDFIDLFAKTLRAQKTKKEIEKIGTKMISLGLNLMVLAPDPVAKAFIFWKALCSEGGDSETMIDAFGKVILEMRKDLIGETTCTPDDAIGMFLRDQL